MIVFCDPTGGHVELRDADVFTSFHAEAPEGASRTDISRLLGTPEPDQAGHVWVPIALVEQSAGDASSDWADGFRSMVEYAVSKGWTNDAGDMLLAHLETT